MEFIVVGSSSKGNCYILKGAEDSLVLECGVRLSDMEKMIDYDIRSIRCVLVSHKHGDHAKYVKDYSKVFPIMAPRDVMEDLGSGYSFHPVDYGTTYKVGEFNITPFQLEHDCPCSGYQISSRSGNILFITDTGRIDYKFGPVDHVLVECNWTEKALMRAIKEGRTDVSQLTRLSSTHLSLESCKEFLKGVEGIEDVVLLHLSDRNSDYEEILEGVRGVTGKPTYIADKNLRLIWDSKEK